MPARARSPASTASSRAPATPARTGLRFRFRPIRPSRWRRRCLTDPRRAADRAWRARQPAAGSRASASTATTSTPRPRRSRPRWNGRCRRAAATAARAPAVFPAPTRSSRSSKRARPRRRVGLKAGRPRAGARRRAAVCRRHLAEPIGKVTSGGFGPSLNAPVAMGYLPTALTSRRHAGFCRSARPAAAAAGRSHALRSQHLQALKDIS